VHRRASACSGVLIEEAVDVGEEHQEVGARQVADQGGQVVVVPRISARRWATVSFSLMMGTTCQPSRVNRVFRALRKRGRIPGRRGSGESGPP